jgi:predicted AlkP superfamily phosphohydrolase/phosphomutase
MANSSSFLVIGLDGATLDIVEPMIESGELPTLGSLAERGTYGRLRSTVPDATVPSWFSICTGANPGEFGIYLHTHLIRKNEELIRKPFDTSDVSLPMLWDILASEGHSAGAFNVPSMYPAVATDDAFLISGGPIGGDDWAAPTSRKPILTRLFLGFTIESRH